MDKKDDWFKLDNAAKLYPAIRRAKWSSVFRMGMELTEPIEPEILEQALLDVLPRFPTFRVQLKRGFFWYYFQNNLRRPHVQPDVQNPCLHIEERKNARFLFRVRFYGNRISLEVFHSLADGTGGLVFLKTLVARYLFLRYQVLVPAEKGVEDITIPPQPGEREDAYLRYATSRKLRARKEDKAYQLAGHPEPLSTLHIITGTLPLDRVKALAKEKNVTLTSYLAAVYLYCLYRYQEEHKGRKTRPVKVSVPVNMRRFFPSETLRNFSLFVNPGVDPAYGEYDFLEILDQVHHFLQFEITAKRLNSQMAKNVNSEKMMAVRLMPLFIKRLALGAIFHAIGESRYTSALSNLGPVELPDAMLPYVQNVQFMLGKSLYNRINAAVCSYGNKLNITFSRSLERAEVERAFFTWFVQLGVPVLVESNN